jgi:UDP-glucose 4-epimerase
MSQRNVLVTGGAGFIGSHLAEAYLRSGARVVVIDDLSNGVRENVPPDAELIVGDLRDPSVLTVMDQRRFDIVSHHAAQMDVRRSVADPTHDADLNIMASLRLLERAAASGVGKIIFASSGGAIYGEPELYPQNEDHPRRPLSPYGCAKLAVENYLYYYATVRGLKYAAMRYANVYGPRQNSLGEAGVVAIFAHRLRGNEELIIHGDGEQTRDFVFVADVVRANMAVSDMSLEGAFNVGTGLETSINDVARMLVEVSGRKSAIHHDEAKMGEQRRSVLTASKLRKAADLAEPVALKEGLRQTWAWFDS